MTRAIVSETITGTLEKTVSSGVIITGEVLGAETYSYR